MLSKLNKDTQVIIQGITGKEGQRVAEFMMAMGVNVVAGVRPGKAGEKVMGVSVFDTVADAREKFPNAQVSCVYVPPQFVPEAVKEAVAAGIKLIHIIAEGIPVKDTADIIALAKSAGASIIGPASLGIIIPDQFKLGSLGGVDNTQFLSGSVGVISRSGGMSSELSNILTQANMGQSMVVHVGGDFLIGTTPADVLTFFEQDETTDRVLMVGEVGGGYEREVVELIKHKKFTKPLVIFIAGAFVESLPQQVPLGHAGAIIQGEADTRRGKIHLLQAVGVKIAQKPDEIVELLKVTSNK